MYSTAADVLTRNAPDGSLYPFQTKPSRKVWNRTGGATTIGYYYMFDTGFTLAAETLPGTVSPRVLPAVSTHAQGDPHGYATSAWNNIIVTPASSTNISNGVFCVALTAAADNDLVEICEVGVCNIWIDGATLTWPAWSHFVPQLGVATPVLFQATNTAIKRLGYTLASRVHTSATPGLVSVFFNGWGIL